MMRWLATLLPPDGQPYNSIKELPALKSVEALMGQNYCRPTADNILYVHDLLFGRLMIKCSNAASPLSSITQECKELYNAGQA